MEPFSIAVTVAVWFDGIVPVDIEKVPDVEPAPTNDEAGAVRIPKPLFCNPTVTPPGGAGALSVIVQMVDELDASAVLLHCSEVTVTTEIATSEMLVEALEPFSEAVSVAT